MRAIRRRVGGKVALINRLIAAFHGSETLEKLFHLPEFLPHPSLAAAFASRMLDAYEKRDGLSATSVTRFYITLEKS